jgi:hypothetical protein
MDYTIAPSVDGLFITLKVKGNMTRRRVMQLNLETHALGRQLRIRRYLVDVTKARNTDSPMEVYEFAYADMQKAEGIDRAARVAILTDPMDHSHDFVETVCRNAGLIVRKFTDRNQARQFLTRETGVE